MKNWLFLFSTIYTFNVFSQDTLSLHQIRFNQIRSIRYSLPAGAQTSIYEDTAFNYFLTQKKNVVPFLIEKSLIQLLQMLNEEVLLVLYKKGDLAIILLSAITSIPYASITKIQWCLCCEAGYLPVNFLAYVDKNRLDFQLKYKAYYSEQERKKNLKRKKKRPFNTGL